jgi:hypothetical protein
MAQHASEKDLLRIYRKRSDWTFRTFTDAVKKETGVAYSGTQGFKLLLRIRNQVDAPKSAKKASAGASTAWMDRLTKAVAEAGSKIKTKSR